MMEITSFPTDSAAQAARILLQGEGIDAEVRGEMIGMAWNNSFRLVVLDDADAERALELVRANPPITHDGVG